MSTDRMLDCRFEIKFGPRSRVADFWNEVQLLEIMYKKQYYIDNTESYVIQLLVFNIDRTDIEKVGEILIEYLDINELSISVSEFKLWDEYELEFD